MALSQSVKRPQISNLIIEQIREVILSRQIRPLEKLPSEHGLAKRFRASRVAVREAIKKLEAVGLVTVKPGLGVFGQKLAPGR